MYGGIDLGITPSEKDIDMKISITCASGDIGNGFLVDAASIYPTNALFRTGTIIRSSPTTVRGFEF